MLGVCLSLCSVLGALRDIICPSLDGVVRDISYMWTIFEHKKRIGGGKADTGQTGDIPAQRWQGSSAEV